VIDGARKGILMGPFGTYADADGQVHLARRLAYDHDPRSAFYAFGVCSAPAPLPLRPVFGKGVGR
jgi:hypothetical protein